MSDAVQKARISVKVGPGMFERERSVSFDAGDRKYSLLVDERDVIDNSKIEVSIVAINPKEDMALIDLPSDTFTSGNRVFVPKSSLIIEHHPVGG